MTRLKPERQGLHAKTVPGRGPANPHAHKAATALPVARPQQTSKSC